MVVTGKYRISVSVSDFCCTLHFAIKCSLVSDQKIPGPEFFLFRNINGLIMDRTFDAY